jgi:hypothetical protein
VRLWGHKPGAEAERAPRADEARRIESQWGVETCSFCGRTLVLGEPVRHVRYQDARASACPECYETFTHPQHLDRAA